jgi:hypothetical protein
MTTQTTTQTAEKTAVTAEDVIVFCRNHDLDAEKVGSWVWVSFAEAPDDELRQAMKDLGFRWSPRRKKWAHNCGTPTKSAHQSSPWEKYDHAPVSGASWKAAAV